MLSKNTMLGKAIYNALGQGNKLTVKDWANEPFDAKHITNLAVYGGYVWGKYKGHEFEIVATWKDAE